MLPFIAFLQIKVRCPHCHKDEVRPRPMTVVGANHRCPRCRRTYKIDKLLSIGTPPYRARG